MTKARDLATSGPSGGLVLIKPGSVVNGTDNGNGVISFTSASSMSLNDVFTSNYDKYRIIVTYQLSGSFALQMRLRASGTDDSASNYAFNISAVNSDNRHAVVGNGTSFAFQFDGSGSYNYYIFDLLNPYLTKNTFINGNIWYDNVTTIFGGCKQTTTSYDGITFFPSGGSLNAVGEVQVYGYKD